MSKTVDWKSLVRKARGPDPRSYVGYRFSQAPKREPIAKPGQPYQWNKEPAP